MIEFKIRDNMLANTCYLLKLAEDLSAQGKKVIYVPLSEGYRNCTILFSANHNVEVIKYDSESILFELSKCDVCIFDQEIPSYVAVRHMDEKNKDLYYRGTMLTDAPRSTYEVHQLKLINDYLEDNYPETMV